ncbi:MAG: ATP-grasp domain-containing protein [Methanosarcinaceae archaeon]|nr:ATP-grasp domain-containing protein [Methanosarcinaceae archaeon]
MKNVLVVGFDTRNIVCSAKRAGYTVHSLDTFRDFDLQNCAESSERYVCESPQEFKQRVPKLIQTRLKKLEPKIEALIPGSGLEGLEFQNLSCPVLASRPEAVKEASDKARFAKKLEALGFSHPRTCALAEYTSLNFPLMVKPVSGGGGVFNRLAQNRPELQAIFEELSGIGFKEEGLIVQEFLEGVPASVSLLSTGKEALSLSVNEQLIGIPWLSRLPFAYCGNISPLKTPFAEEMERISEALVLEYGLRGSSGVDFLLTEKGPVVLELNPRFQGSLDSVELATGLNLFKAHVRSFSGELPEKPAKMRFAGRGVLYSDRELFIDEGRMGVILREKSVDIPNVGDVAGPDGPLTSILAEASSRNEVLKALKAGANRIKTAFGINLPEGPFYT